MRSVPRAVATGSQRSRLPRSQRRDPVATALGTDLIDGTGRHGLQLLSEKARNQIRTRCVTKIHAPSPDPSRDPRSFFAGGMLIVVAIALGKLVFHCVFNNRYGYFRDEFDYMSCGDHLAWGYVDQPPLLPWLVRLSRVVLGDSLRSSRFLAALGTAPLVVLASPL